MQEALTGPSTDGVEELTVPARTVVGLRERVSVTDLPAFFGRAVPTVTVAFESGYRTRVSYPLR